MKIGFVVPTFTPTSGGASTAPYNLGRALSARGHDVFIFTTDHKRNVARFPDESGLKLHVSRRLLGWPGFDYSPELARELEIESAELDLIHLNIFRSYQNIIARRLAVRHGIPYVLQARGSLPRAGKRLAKVLFDLFYGKRILADASAVIALTKTEAAQYEESGVPKTKIRVLPNGVEIPNVSGEGSPNFYQNKLGLRSDTNVLLLLGRISKTKGADILIQAFSMLDKSAVRDTALVIAGPDDGYLNEIKVKVRSHDLESKVFFPGLVTGPDKVSAIAGSRAVIVPSRYETFPNVILEAYACAKPVVASDVESISDLVFQGETGLLFENEDTSQLAERLMAILTDPLEADAMGRRGKQLVLEKYAMDKVAQAYEALYEEIVRSQ